MLVDDILNREFSIGWELEFNFCTPECAEQIIDSDYGYCKPEYDTDDGFELESCIFDRSDFVRITDDKYAYWSELFNQLEETESSISDYVGHHIHVNYNACNPNKLHRIMECLHFNYDLLCIFAERDFGPTSGFDLMPLKDVICPTSSYRQFVHCNTITNGTRTTEFRFFASTDEVDTFLKNQQFVIAWYDFAEVEEGFLSKGAKVLWKNFLNYIKENPTVYPQLTQFISENETEIKEKLTEEFSCVSV